MLFVGLLNYLEGRWKLAIMWYSLDQVVWKCKFSELEVFRVGMPPQATRQVRYRCENQSHPYFMVAPWAQLPVRFAVAFTTTAEYTSYLYFIFYMFSLVSLAYLKFLFFNITFNTHSYLLIFKFESLKLNDFDVVPYNPL